MYFYCNVFTNMFRPVIRLASSGCFFKWKNTIEI